MDEDTGEYNVSYIERYIPNQRMSPSSTWPPEPRAS